MATFKAVVFTTKNHIKADGTTNIKIRIYHNKESQYLPTDYYIFPRYIGRDGNIGSEFPDSETLNYEIGSIIQNYRSILIKLGTERTSRMNCAEIREQLLNGKSQNAEFIDFVEFSRNVIKETKKKNTAEWYDTGIKSIVWFFGREKIDARDITRVRLEEYIKRMNESGMNEKKMDSGAINTYLRAIRSLYNKCKKRYNQEDYGIIPIPNNPFKGLNIPRAKKKRKNITIEEIKKIRDFECKTERQIFAKDTFMMLFYLMGININDFYNLDNPKNGRIQYERSKTDRNENVNGFPLSIKIEPELKTLNNKYGTVEFISEIKKRYSNSKSFNYSVNRGLKEICKSLNIPKITTNWARHSWATIARNKAKIAKADVDFCLGHVNNDYKMADIYIDIDYGICDDSNRKVLNLLLDDK